jgi:hypothetical protein
MRLHIDKRRKSIRVLLDFLVLTQALQPLSYVFPDGRSSMEALPFPCHPRAAPACRVGICSSADLAWKCFYQEQQICHLEQPACHQYQQGIRGKRSGEPWPGAPWDLRFPFRCYADSKAAAPVCVFCTRCSKQGLNRLRKNSILQKVQKPDRARMPQERFVELQ